MGRTRGSKNGVRKVPLKKPKVKPVKKSFEADSEAENLDPNFPVFDFEVLKAYKAQQYGKCIELIERILSYSGSNEDHHKILMAASLIMLNKKINRAHSILDEVLRSNPMDSNALYAKGVAFYFEEKMEESVAMFDKALEVTSGLEMDRARDMKSRIDQERRKAVILMKKDENNIKVNQENCKNNQKVLKIHDEVIDIIETDANETNQDKIVNSSGEIEAVIEVFNEEESKTTQKHSENPESDLPIPDIPESLPKSFNPKTAEEFYQKGMELYLCGSLEKSLQMFEKSTEIDANFRKSDVMASKAQEFVFLIETLTINMDLENYGAVVEIINEALMVDKSNLHVNRSFHFQRGLALYRSGNNEESLKDYAEYEKLNKILTED